ncbi:type II toxin-antitoxin system RelE/ParE family toxin [soil metagenome]
MLAMIESFADKATEDIFNGDNSTAARRLLPRELWKFTFRKFDQIDSATTLDDLRIPPGNRLEALKAERSGQHSIRINDQYRICFRWTQSGAVNVEIVDYH